MDSHEKLEDKVTELIQRLPPMQSSIKHLLLLSSKPNFDKNKFIQQIKKDPGLCVDLLRLANTFCGDFEGHYNTIEEAIDIVGTQPLIQLMGAWCTNDIVQKEFVAIEHLDEYFQHSQVISLGCRILSEATGVKDYGCEVSAVAGLIHDMGRLVIMLACNKTAATLMGTPWDKMESVVVEERRVLGMDHCQVGMQICKKWNFSTYLQEGVLRHHSPLIKGDFNYLGAMIFVAHFLTSSDFTGEMLTSMLPVEITDRLNITESDFKKARDEYFSRSDKNA